MLIKTIFKNIANSRDGRSVMAETMGLESDHLSFYSGFPFLVEFSSY